MGEYQWKPIVAIKPGERVRSHGRDAEVLAILRSGPVLLLTIRELLTGEVREREYCADEEVWAHINPETEHALLTAEERARFALSGRLWASTEPATAALAAEIHAAVAAEREACAQLCEEMARQVKDMGTVAALTAHRLAQAIRARGSQQLVSPLPQQGVRGWLRRYRRVSKRSP